MLQNTIRYISIDDNPVDLLILKEYASIFPFLQHAGSFSTPAEGLAGIDTLHPDLVFLDIEMSGQTGLDILRALKGKVPITIFITSHPEFALEGFELSALDYILKPLTAERFSHTARRIEEYWDMKQKAISYQVLFEKESLTIKEGHNHIKLSQQDIIYLEAMQDYTKVVTDKKSYLTLSTLTDFLANLSPENFLRIHRSYAVAVQKIKEVHTRQLICGNNTIPIGKTYKSAIHQLKIG